MSVAETVGARSARGVTASNACVNWRLLEAVNAYRRNTAERIRNSSGNVNKDTNSFKRRIMPSGQQAERGNPRGVKFVVKINSEANCDVHLLITCIALHIWGARLIFLFKLVSHADAPCQFGLREIWYSTSARFTLALYPRI